MFRLKQRKDGMWECRHSDKPRSFTEGRTPEEALKKAKIALKAFRKFIAAQKDIDMGRLHDHEDVKQELG